MAPSMRARVAVILALSCPAGAADSGESVTESEAIRLFLEESPHARRVPWIEQAVSADRRIGTRVSNPQMAYQIEDAAGVRDEFLTFQQELPITGRRGLVQESAGAAATAARLTAERELLATAFMVRMSFYEVLYRERSLDRMREGKARLERIVDIVASRERAGDGAGYDLLRAEQELAEFDLATAGTEADLSVARTRFGAFFDPGERMAAARLEGDLEPGGAVPEADEAVERALSGRSDLRALRAEVERLDLDLRAAKRQRFPDPTLTAGWKRTEALGLDDTGYIAALTVPLPIFERGQLAAARATAERERVVLEVEILEREIRADVLAALAHERAARQAAQRHGAGIALRAGEMRRIAELAYDEGEAGILELLDAYRTAQATELRVLALGHTARRAKIERDRAIGFEVQP